LKKCRNNSWTFYILWDDLISRRARGKWTEKMSKKFCEYFLKFITVENLKTRSLWKNFQCCDNFLKWRMKFMNSTSIWWKKFKTYKKSFPTFLTAENNWKFSFIKIYPHKISFSIFQCFFSSSIAIFVSRWEMKLISF
jgi:hypothetical protein